MAFSWGGRGAYIIQGRKTWVNSVLLQDVSGSGAAEGSVFITARIRYLEASGFTVPVNTEEMALDAVTSVS